MSHAPTFHTAPSPAFPRGVRCSLTHLNAGWRYWVRCAGTGDDESVGFDPSGYATEAEARLAADRVRAARPS